MVSREQEKATLLGNVRKLSWRNLLPSEMRWQEVFRHDFKIGLARSGVIQQKQRKYTYVESCRLAVH